MLSAFPTNVAALRLAHWALLAHLLYMVICPSDLLLLRLTHLVLCAHFLYILKLVSFAPCNYYHESLMYHHVLPLMFSITLLDNHSTVSLVMIL